MLAWCSFETSCHFVAHGGITITSVITLSSIVSERTTFAAVVTVPSNTSYITVVNNKHIKVMVTVHRCIKCNASLQIILTFTFKYVILPKQEFPILTYTLLQCVIVHVARATFWNNSEISKWINDYCNL